MKLLLVVITFIAYAALMFSGNPTHVAAVFSHAFSTPPLDSKIQPKEVELGKDSKHDTWGAAKFNHETHATKNYSIDGSAKIACIECHHTDQPAPKPPLKTSERKVALTTETLAAADAAPVKSCRTCHFQEDSGKKQPVVAYDGEDVELNNMEAYHRNCNTCHDAVKAKRPQANAPNTCATCHAKKA